jgi:hypothetical protein
MEKFIQTCLRYAVVLATILWPRNILVASSIINAPVTVSDLIMQTRISNQNTLQPNKSILQKEFQKCYTNKNVNIGTPILTQGKGEKLLP